MHRVTHDCDHWYAIFYCSINGFLQTGFPVVLQNDPVCLGRNTHVHVVQFVIGGSPIRSHDFQKDVVLCRSFPCTCIYSLPELGIRTVHDQVILILIYFFFFFLKTCFFCNAAVIGFSCHIDQNCDRCKYTQDIYWFPLHVILFSICNAGL